MGAIVSALARLFGLGGVFKSIFGGIFNSLNSGIQLFIKWLIRLMLLSVFSALVISVINFFTAKIQNYSLDDLDSCASYAINIMGIFPALSLFLKILSVGFLAKHLLTYWRETT